MSEIETDYTANVICPFCGYEDNNSWEINFGPCGDGETEIICDSCEKNFIASRHVSVNYSSWKKEEPRP
jgi:alanyl-tRNA synthetase